MNERNAVKASPVFGLRYLEDIEIEGLDIVGCLGITLVLADNDGGGDGGGGGGATATGCDDTD